MVPTILFTLHNLNADQITSHLFLWAISPLPMPFLHGHQQSKPGRNSAGVPERSCVLPPQIITFHRVVQSSLDISHPYKSIVPGQNVFKRI